MPLDRAFDVVIFGVDSTLVDSRAAVVKAWEQWAAEFDVKKDDISDLIGCSSKEIVHRLTASRAKEARARIDELERQDSDETVAMPGAVDALTAIPQDLQAIATSSTRAVATRRLAAAGLRVPPIFITADDVDRAKPDPEIFLTAAAWLGADPRRCLVIENSPNGLAAARAAGCATLAVTSTHPAHRLDGDLVIPDLSAVTFRSRSSGIYITRQEN
ncbi:MAG: HAD-IA family hydrolase [Propionibacteriaceae bacterium]